jgi:hypothetical protein
LTILQVSVYPDGMSKKTGMVSTARMPARRADEWFPGVCLDAPKTPTVGEEWREVVGDGVAWVVWVAVMMWVLSLVFGHVHVVVS